VSELHFDVTGAAGPKAFFSRLKKTTIAHAYVFTGPQGVGKKTFARRLAQSLLCEAPKESVLGYDGTCAACKLTGKEETRHPDFFESSGALKIGGAAAAFSLADTVLPDTTSAAPTAGTPSYEWTSTAKPVALGRPHVVPSNNETVVQGLFDPTKAPTLTVDSGDVIAYENTWTHFLNKLQPGVPAEELANMRRNSPGRGVHSIIGPIAVKGAMPGDTVQFRFLRLETVNFGANFHNPGHLRTGSLPDDFADGYVRYFELDPAQRYVAFNDRIRLETKPFQGTIGLAAEEPHAISSVAPGRHAGNMDNKELVAGSTLYIPVFAPGALFEIGDGHAAQGDGEVDQTAIETSLRGRLQLTVHKGMALNFPRAETAADYISMGFDPDLTKATTIAIQEMVDFIAAKWKMSKHQAYQLVSVAGNVAVTQLVDKPNHGDHVRLPKSIFIASPSAGGDQIEIRPMKTRWNASRVRADVA